MTIYSGGSAASTAVTPRLGAFGGAYIFTDRNRPHANALTDGIAVSATSRLRFIALRAASEITALFDNANLSTAQTHSITIKASWDIAGVITPMFFDGRRSVAIEPGGFAPLPDPVAVAVAALDAVFVRTHVIVTSGDKWSRGLSVTAGNGEGSNYTAGSGTPAADLTDSGTVTTGGAYVYGPVAVLATA